MCAFLLVAAGVTAQPPAVKTRVTETLTDASGRVLWERTLPPCPCGPGCRCAPCDCCEARLTVLTARRDHVQRCCFGRQQSDPELKILMRELLQLNQQILSLLQQMQSHQGSTPAAPPQIIMLSPGAGAPLQALPIAGAPLQVLPIAGAPLQVLPIAGAPLQVLPPGGAPKQDLPGAGPPKQDLPPGGTAPKQDLPIEPGKGKGIGTPPGESKPAPTGVNRYTRAIQPVR